MPYELLLRKLVDRFNVDAGPVHIATGGEAAQPGKWACRCGGTLATYVGNRQVIHLRELGGRAPRYAAGDRGIQEDREILLGRHQCMFDRGYCGSEESSRSITIATAGNSS